MEVVVTTGAINRAKLQSYHHHQQTNIQFIFLQAGCPSCHPTNSAKACHKKWGFADSELCGCGEVQTMSHIVNSCPLTKFDGGLLRLHEADEAAVDWLTTYGS